MLTENRITELLEFLNREQRKLNVVLLPDFFQDRLVSLNADEPHFEELVRNVVKRKGGSVDGISQTDLNGGNAINTASALASLGATVTPIVCTDDFGLYQMKYRLKKYHVDFSHVKIVDKPSKTTALEFRSKNETINVMLRDVGGLSDFGPSNLTESDYSIIEDSDYACLFNWAGTKNYGTLLAQTVFRRARKGKGRTYFDTADPTPNIEEAPELMKRVLKTNQVDILSLNENEAISYAGLLSEKLGAKSENRSVEEHALQCARDIAKTLQSRIDLHTTAFSATITKQNEVVIPSFPIRPLRATGAGDAWNAGNIIADGNSLSEENRLVFANAVSACYLSDPQGRHPDKQRLIKFLKAAN